MSPRLASLANYVCILDEHITANIMITNIQVVINKADSLDIIQVKSTAIFETSTRDRSKVV